MKQEKNASRNSEFQKGTKQGGYRVFFESALKENQEKMARLQGIQSTDGSDVADQTAARLGNLLIF